MKSFVSALSAFIKKNYPEIRRAVDITPEAAQAYMNEHLERCSDRTVTVYKHRFKKLAAIVNRVYYGHLDFSGVVFKRRGTGRVRDIAFSEEDYQKLKRELYKTGNDARFIPEMTNSIGTRIEEVVSLKPEEVHLDERYVELNNCKNGRNRTVPIREKDVPLWERLLSHAKENGWETMAGGISTRNAMRAIGRAKHRAGIAEKYYQVGNHGIRKKYARERLKEELDRGLDLEEAWIKVQSELGHGAHARPELFRAYIGKNYSISLRKFRNERS